MLPFPHYVFLIRPIDVVKTKIQANPKKYNKGMVNAASQILKDEGPNSLLGGLGPTVVGYGIEGAMKFVSNKSVSCRCFLYSS